MDKIVNAKIEPGRVAIQWLGQGGFAFKAHAGDIIVVDPYLSDSANGDGNSPRLVEVPVKPRDVTASFLFLTHDHIDHTDPLSAPAIAHFNPDCKIVCPPSSTKILSRCGVSPAGIIAAMAGQVVEFPNFTARVVKAQHSEDSVGYVFEFNGAPADAAGPVVYITGDSEYWDGMADAVMEYGPDVLIVPINGKWGNMSALEAALLAKLIDPAEVIPMHYGMFAANTVDPAQFVAHLAAECGPDSNIVPVVMKHNACHVYCPRETEGRYNAKQQRAERARHAHKSHEHKDGVRGPSSSGSQGKR
jgi:L-ascorbate 6-phosphate lactonase